MFRRLRRGVTAVLVLACCSGASQAEAPDLQETKDAVGWPSWISPELPGEAFSEPGELVVRVSSGKSLDWLLAQAEFWPDSRKIQAEVAARLAAEGREEESRKFAARAGRSVDIDQRLVSGREAFVERRWGEAFELLSFPDGGAWFARMSAIALQHSSLANLAARGWKVRPEDSVWARGDTTLRFGPPSEGRFRRIKLGAVEGRIAPNDGELQISEIGLEIVAQPATEVSNLATDLAGDQGATEQVGTSVEGRPIFLHTLGTGQETVVFFGVFHGDEPESKLVLDELLFHLRKNPDLLAQRRAVIVPVVNPDGLNRGTRKNANQVDLNRNFPTNNWNSEGRETDYWGGPAPGSEPETKVVMEILQRFKPARIITIHCPYRCVNYDGPAEKLAQAISAQNGYKVEPSIGYPTPGSFGTYAGIEGRTPTITLELPPTGAEPVWNDNRSALIKALRG